MREVAVALDSKVSVGNHQALLFGDFSMLHNQVLSFLNVGAEAYLSCWRESALSWYIQKSKIRIFYNYWYYLLQLQGRSCSIPFSQS